MKLPLYHDTNIEPLLHKINSETCFLSNWNKENNSLNFPPEIIKNAVNSSLDQSQNNYFFLDELQEAKKWFIHEALDNTNVNSNNFDFSISSNGTSSAYLLINLFHMKKKMKALLITPIYFTYIKVLQDLKVDTYYIEVLEEGKVTINLHKLEDIIIEYGINLLIMNDPLLGSGIKITKEMYIDIVNICKKHDVTLFIDFMYGGMEWNLRNLNVIDEFLLSLFDIYPEIIIIESISKRLFLNGIKNCLVYGSKENISLFERVSVHSLGSLVYSQVTLFKQLYDSNNRSTVLNTIKSNILFAMNNFELIKTLLMDTEYVISDCESGYFCLIGVPYSEIGNKNNMDIASKLIENINILTIPHDRYLFESQTHYYFRVNLSIEQSILIPALRKIVEFYSRSKTPYAPISI
ncbi:hypothetical protein BS614_16580 [Paenibacillus xylanexedens]|uniref:aminotransferase class I/II-fold pyridoxal phosphate-dependent enzyme n=1 Tax=Paenibacillus xylanexedens TaxID=528191 RepID=UPI000938539C|nr:aminotransferase class I/II-fold pyridoxal phosphate-dependent enzyme [Paenibacillus xylanexedens]APO45473.1 hypothetical protein BS614_16580 [Paenibacillus xylanexedens]